MAKSPIKYTISEVKGTDASVTYDEHIETITLTLADDGEGAVTVTADKAIAEVVFTNTCSQSVSVKKTDVATGEELEGATIQILDKDGNVVDEWVSTTEAHEVTGLETGEIYTLHEEVAPDGYTIAADTTFTIDGEGKVTSTGTVTQDGILLIEDAKTHIEVSKVDVANGEELEGAHIQIIDSEGNVVDEWDSTEEAHEVEGLKTGEEYTLRETVAPEGYTVTTDTTFTIDEEGNVTSTGTCTTDENGNTVLLVEDAKTHIEVSKVDATSGEELEGATIQILDSEGNVVDEWVSSKDETHVIEGLKTGETYTLRETVAPEGYDVTTDTTFTIDEEGKVTSTGTVTYDEEGHTILLVEDERLGATAAIRKVWDDDGNRDGVRPVSVTVNLLANGEKVKTVTLTAANGWICVVRDLPKVDKDLKDIEYTWEEPVAGTGYTLGGIVTKGTLTTITNVHGPEKTNVSVRKVWDDAENAKRPSEIKVQLYGDGRAVGKAVTLNAANGWKYTWEGLDKNCNTAGTTGTAKAIAYTVEELEIPEGYQATITGNAETGFVITNRLERGKLVIRKAFDVTEPEPEEETEPELMDIQVTKIWVDNDNQDGIRPGSVTVHLYAGGEEIDSAVLSEATGWKHTFTELQKYYRGNRIRYSVKEDPVEGYTAQVNGYTIRNIHKPEEVSISVRKVWDDKDNAAGLRPTSIRCTLSNGTSVLLKAESGWMATVSGLPKYANGQEIVYTWTEQAIVGYKLESKETKGAVTTFTNTLVGIPEPPEGYKKPRVPGGEYAVFEEYATALGIQVYINHVGDCFD